MPTRRLLLSVRPAEAMPVLQVLLICLVETYERLRDDIFKWYYVPYWQGWNGLEEADKQLKEAQKRWEGVPFTMLLLIGGPVYFTAASLGRRIAALRCIEALRMYAADHRGRLPDVLDDITEVPVPTDPVNGKRFIYKAVGGKTILEAPAPPGMDPQRGRRYELTIRR